MPRKKNSKDKEIEGTARKDRSGMIPASDKIPAPSKSLSQDARAYYFEISQHLLDNGAIQDVDRLIIERAAKCYADLLTADEELKKNGAISTGKNGSKYIGPYFNLVQSLEKRWQDYCKELGIGPKSRHLMSGTFEKPEAEETDELAALMGVARTDQNTSVG